MESNMGRDGAYGDGGPGAWNGVGAPGDLSLRLIGVEECRDDQGHPLKPAISESTNCPI